MPLVGQDSRRLTDNTQCAGQPPRMVAVPTHFFKVVLAERGDSSSVERADAPSNAVLGAFVLPNAPLPPDVPLTAFSVPLEPLEEAAGAFHCSDDQCLSMNPIFSAKSGKMGGGASAGLQFFTNLLNADRRAALDTAALAYQRWGRQQMQNKGMVAMELPLLQPAQTTKADWESTEQQLGTSAGRIEPVEPITISTATDMKGVDWWVIVTLVVWNTAVAVS